MRLVKSDRLFKCRLTHNVHINDSHGDGSLIIYCRITNESPINYSCAFSTSIVMSQFYALKCFTLFFLGGFLATEALPKQRSVLSEVNRSKLERTIVELEKVRQPAARFESLLSSAERSLEKQLRTIKHELKQLNISENLNETYYQTLSFTQVLNIVLQNLRAQGRTNLANQIQELATYVIGLERIKASGIYNGTEMERTLDRSIYENKKKLVDIINSLIQN